MSQAKDGVFTWIHADHLSSATRITDVNGLEIRRLAYTSFGEEAENQGTGDDPKYQYTGKEHDATGLYYSGTRYYDPALSRFITADTVYDVGPQGLNRYSYALNNPILYCDPTGHQASFFQGLQDAPPLFKRAVGKNIRAETQAVAKGAVEGVKVGAIVYTSIVVPGAGEALDVAVLCDKNSSTTAKIAAGVSLGVSLLTFGLGPNYGAIDETVEAGAKVSTLDDTIHTGAIDDTIHAGAVDDTVHAGAFDDGLEGASTAGKWSPDKGFYEVGFEAKLSEGIHYPDTSDVRHFQEANKQLHEAFQADPKFAQEMEKIYPGIVDGVKPGKRGAFPRRAPTKDVTWHHHPDREGVLQLIPRDQHKSGGAIQETLHPDGRGGMENWGGGR